MTQAINYKTTTHEAMIGDRKITVHNKIPVFSTEDERKTARRRIENGLYNIFAKYIEK